MKVIKLISLCLVITFTGISCSNNSDDTEQSVTQSNLTGKWYADTQDPNIIDFNSNGKVYATYFNAGTNGQDLINTGAWSLSGNTIKIHWDQADPGLENWSAEILTLTNSKLVWKEFVDGYYSNYSFHR